MSDQTIAGHGFSVVLPAGWEGRIYRRPTPSAAFTPQNRAATAVGRQSGPAGDGWLGEQPRGILHLGNFALPADRGDYGSGAVEAMGPQHALVCMLEFGQECLGTALYSSVGLPRVAPGSFDPNGLQRRIVGQSGSQHFFTENSRPMCLYVVLGSHRNAVALTGRVNQMLDRIRVDAR